MRTCRHCGKELVTRFETCSLFCTIALEQASRRHPQDPKVPHFLAGMVGSGLWYYGGKWQASIYGLDEVVTAAVG